MKKIFTILIIFSITKLSIAQDSIVTNSNKIITFNGMIVVKKSTTNQPITTTLGDGVDIGDGVDVGDEAYIINTIQKDYIKEEEYLLT